MKKFISLFLFLAFSLGAFEEADAAARRRRNPRRRHKAAAATQAPGAVSRPKVPTPILSPGRWAPDVLKTVESFIRARGTGGADYNSEKPPAAVFVLSDCAIVNDLGEAVLRRMVERVDFKFDEEFWRLVPVVHGRIALQGAYENFASLPVSVWREQASHRQYRKGFLKAYRDMCSGEGIKECRLWLSRLLYGFTQEELAALAKVFIKEEFAVNLGPEVIEGGPGDKEPAVVRGGLRAVPELRDLANKLVERGFEVWLLGDEARPFVAAAAEEFGLPAERALGALIDFSSGTARASGEVLEPFPFRGGKASVVASALGRAPALIVGASSVDVELMSFGSGLRLLMDRGDSALADAARDRGWLIQAAFGP